MSLSDGFFNKIERKTNVNKETILKLANRLKNGNMKNEETIRSIINDLSNITGKEVSKEQCDKIISTVLNENVPKNIENMID